LFSGQNSTNVVNNGTRGALQNTLGTQLYSRNASIGYAMFNDQKPIGSDSSSFGHSKGVLGWDNRTRTAFWLVHSIPKFPMPVASGFLPVDNSQCIFGQSALCVSTDFAGLAVVSRQFWWDTPQMYTLKHFTRAHVHTYIRTHMCKHTYIHTYIHTCIHTHIHTFTQTFVHYYTNTHPCTHLHTCIHMYIYIHIHTHPYTRTHAHTHTRTSIPCMAVL
jgi:hypothetical protein